MIDIINEMCYFLQSYANDEIDYQDYSKYAKNFLTRNSSFLTQNNSGKGIYSPFSILKYHNLPNSMYK